MPTNQLAPLVSTTRINLAGNSFQVIMEMDGGVDDGVATLLPDGDDRTATLSWNPLINIMMTCLGVFCNSQSLFRLQLQEVPSHALRSLQRLEQLDLSHLARLSQVQVSNTDDHDGNGDHIGEHSDDGCSD